MKNIIILIIFIWATTNFVVGQCGSVTNLEGQTTGLPNLYENSCDPIPRKFKLTINLNKRNDNIVINNIYLNQSCSGFASLATPTPINGTTFLPADTSEPAYKEFIFEMQDFYTAFSSGGCFLKADWTYHVGNAGTSHSCTDMVIGGYPPILSLITNPVSVLPTGKQCGKADDLDVVVKYENDISTYVVTMLNGSGTLISTPVKTTPNGPCYPQLSFKIRPNGLCGDVSFQIVRTNAVGSKTDNLTIKSKITPALPSEITTFSGTTNFCVQGPGNSGSAGAILLGPLNNHFWGTTIPPINVLNAMANNIMCNPRIRAEWTLETGDPNGIFLQPSSPGADLFVKLVKITMPGAYTIKYTFTCDGNDFIRYIQLTACGGAPSLGAYPPIGIQFICSLEGKEAYCDYITTSCNSTNFTATSTDQKLFATTHSVYDTVANANITRTQICLGSIFLRDRISPLKVTATNACGTSTVTWNIYIDNPEHCKKEGLTNGEFKLNISNQNSSLVATITPTGIENLNAENEIIQSLEIYDISGRLIYSQLNINNATFEIPTQNLEQNTIYILRVSSDKNEYSAKFIKS